MKIKTSFIEIGDGVNQIEALLETLNVYDGNGEIINEVSDDDKWDLIRKLRDELLEQSDWVVIKSMETGEDIDSRWVTYRQDLRDIPQDFDTPEEVVLPNLPN